MKPLKKLQKESPKFFRKSMEKGAIQFLTWANTGTGKSSKKPPIRWGVLRGSSSAFVGSKLVSIFKQATTGEEQPTPAEQYNGDPSKMTWVWNTKYATKMHEWKGNWGPYTKQDGSAGAKWAEEALDANSKDLIKMIETEFFKLMSKSNGI